MEVSMKKNVPKIQENSNHGDDQLLLYDRRNSLPSEHVLGFHPASQSPRGHCPFKLLHPTPFKQWHVLLHPLPKKPLSQAVIRKHMENENEIFVNENKKLQPVSSK